MAGKIDEDGDAVSPLDAGLRRGFKRLLPAPGPEAARTSGPAPEADFALRYRMGPELGRGGMGIVHRAHDVQLGRDVAVKLLRPELRASAERCRRFIGEARIASRLEHPGIVPVYDRGVTEEGEPYFTMKLIAGETLKDRLERLGDDRAARWELLPAVQRVAEALAAAHAQGVVHRDLKPSNVMLGGFGEVLVTDFGLAKVLDAGPESSDGMVPSASPLGTSATSAEGQILGTPRYMAPEQASGGTIRIGPTADVYALGALLHEVLTGRPPPRILTASDHAGDERSLLDAGVPEDLKRLVLACLAIRPEARPASATEVGTALAAHQSAREAAVLAAERRADVASATAREERRSRRLVIALSIVLLLAIGGGSGSWMIYEHARAGRASEAEAAAERALRGAAAASTRAETIATAEALGAWREAVLAAEAAATAASLPEVGAGRAAEARSQLAHSLEGLRSETDAATRRAADDALRTRLARIRTVTLVRPDLEALDREYADAFRTWGCDVLVEDRAVIVARLVASPLRRDILDALHSWWHARSNLRSNMPRDAAWLLRLAGDLDDDERSRALIDLRLSKNLEAVVAWVLREDLVPLLPLPLVQIANATHDAGRLDDAILILRRIVFTHPDSVEAQATLAVNVAMRGGVSDFVEASRAAAAAVALRPELAALHFHLVTSLHRSGSQEEARRRLASLRAQSPAEPYHLHAEGAIAFLEERPDDAIASLREVCRIDPGNFDAGHFLGQILASRGLHQEAEQVLRTYLARHPKAASSSALGRILIDEGCWLEAEARLREAVRREPSVGSHHLHLGRTLDLLHRYEHAAASFQAALTCARPLAVAAERKHAERLAVDCDARRMGLAGKLSEFQEGALALSDSRLALALAGHCRDQDDPSAESLVWKAAFEVFPELTASWGACAAEAALRAAAAAPEGLALRDNARRWIESELELLAGEASGNAARRARLVSGWWKRAPSFASVRGEEALSRMPSAEAAAWRAFWARVDALGAPVSK